jgi:hypothetical protein
MRHDACHSIFCGALVALLLAAPALAADKAAPSVIGPVMLEGVNAYRQGDFKTALDRFEGLRQKAPDNPKITYYYAITLAQVGRYEQAKAQYQTVLKLDPDGEFGRLAKEGMGYLPADVAIDPPPRWQQPQAQPNGMSQPSAQPNPANPFAAASQNPDALQQMMLMQMMAGGMGGNNNGGGMGMNPMLMPMLMQQGGNGSPMDPNAMSTMMMNQMLQNFDMSGGGKNNE